MSEQTLTTGQIITLGDGRLACDIGAVYEALNALLDDDLMTHQLLRAGRFVEPHVQAACPRVTDLPPLNLGGVEDEGAAVLAWVDQISAEHGPLHTVPDLSGQWVHLNPIDEAVAMVGKDRVTIVGVDPDEQGVHADRRHDHKSAYKKSLDSA